MRIALNAHLLSGTAGYRSAGIHRYIDQLLKHLPAALPEDWRLTAFTGAQSTAEYAGIDLRRSRRNTDSAARRIVWEQAAQPWQLRGFDAYHALAFVGPLLGAPPSVVTVYDLSFIHTPERLPASRRLYLRWLTALTCRRARRVIGISQSTARDVVATFGIPAERVDVAAPGVDSARFFRLPQAEIEAFRRARSLPPRFWLFMGTLEPRKNLVTLIEAYAALPESQRLPLVIAGGKGWEFAPIFDAVERHQLQDAIQFPGFVPFDELALWYNSAETFIYPSVFEGFGLPVLEAMACGVPVIVSDASSLPEIAANAGLCLPPLAVGAWTEALRRAVGDDEWRRSAADAGLREASRFTWNETARQTAAAYQRAFYG
ncbi:MAG TPA: glycosyltransferase family 1 protein [Candidatus Limnocylindrales bacterium]|nr:glycosyltransferase family 1 protein [Candidatus Limnocylindrales bacterium]